MSVEARRRVVRFWDAHVQSWLEGMDPLEEPLGRWFASYDGRGKGRVTRDGFVEPYQGDLEGSLREPRVVVLALNPGIYQPDMQSRGGPFAGEIRQHGSYSQWVLSHPYDRDPWVARHGVNRFYTARRAFTRRWLGDPNAGYDDMVMFELFPWHSTAVTAPMRPPWDVIDEFVWQPIAELGVEHVFAFGRPWEGVAKDLGLRCVSALGLGGKDYSSRVPSRAVRVYELPQGGPRLVVEWHCGGAGPPNLEEVELLRRALGAR